MTQTFTRTPALTAPIVPAKTQAYEYDWDVRNNLHAIVGRADVEATLKLAGLRSGRMVAVFTDRAAAFAADAAFRAVGVWTFTDTDVPEASMVFVLRDSGALRQAGVRTWELSFGYQEVVA